MTVMMIFHLFYIFLGSGLALILLPAVWHHYKGVPGKRKEIRQRLGYEENNKERFFVGRPRIWIHAVSVGEVQVAEIIIQELARMNVRGSILLTTTTIAGQEYAHKQLADRATIRFAPLDLWGAIRRFFMQHRPDLLVCVETEIWPNWIARAHHVGCKIAICNGRISSRSIRSYKKIRRFLKPSLEKIDAFSMISNVDARRIRALGAPPQRIQVNGNVKMDAEDRRCEKSNMDDLKRLYKVGDETQVFIAGSIRQGEMELLLDVFLRVSDQIPETVFIIAPRHLEKTKRIVELARQKGMVCQCRTDLKKGGGERNAPLVVLDTIGELRQVYALATVVFCGGSLVPLGGQNVLEPAVKAKPVLYGPHMDDFEKAKDLLEAFGGGTCVKNQTELADQAILLLSNPEEARRIGLLARQAVLSNRGAALRHARVIQDLLI